jgi:predicted ferric reductase
MSTQIIQKDGGPPESSSQAGVVPALLLIAGASAVLALVVLPIWVPVLSSSLNEATPRGYWYLSRASALVAYGMLWMSMVLGLLMTNKLARVWPGGPTAFDLHEHTSLLGLGFALFHVLVLLGDHYINYAAGELLVPFASANYRPFWVGLGQIGIYLLAVLIVSFPLRRRLGTRTWRAIHFISFAVFALALGHGVFSGTDSLDWWARGMYLFTGGSVLFLTIYRMLARRTAPQKAGPAYRTTKLTRP